MSFIVASQIGVSSQSHRTGPGVDLTKGILLPLVRGSAVKDIGALDEGAHARRAVAAWVLEFCDDMREAVSAALMIEQRAAIFGGRVDSRGIIPDRVIDVVGVFLLVSPVEGEA